MKSELSWFISFAIGYIVPSIFFFGPHMFPHSYNTYIIFVLVSCPIVFKIFWSLKKKNWNNRRRTNCWYKWGSASWYKWWWRIIYGTKNFKKEILEKSDDPKYIFERDKYWIDKYDAIISDEFYNTVDEKEDMEP